MYKFILGTLIFLLCSFCSSSMEREFFMSCNKAWGPQRSPASLVKVESYKSPLSPVFLYLKYSDNFSIKHQIERDLFSPRLIQLAILKLSQEIRPYTIFHDFSLRDFNRNHLTTVSEAFKRIQREYIVDERKLTNLPRSFAYEFDNCESFSDDLIMWILNKELRTAYNFTYRPTNPINIYGVLDCINCLTMPRLRYLHINLPSNFETDTARIISGKTLDNLKTISFYYKPSEFSPVKFLENLAISHYLPLSRICVECSDEQVYSKIVATASFHEVLKSIGVVVIFNESESHVCNFDGYESDYPELYLSLRD